MDNIDQLRYACLGVIRARNEEEMLYGNLAGFASVSNIDKINNMITFLLPSAAPGLPSFNVTNNLTYFVVPGDIQGMTYMM